MAKSSIRELFDSVNRSIRNRVARLELLLGFIAFPIIAIGISVVWPYALYIHYNAMRNKTKNEKARLLSVSRGDLIKRMSISEIEVMEEITDPLGAVPDLPFGHLNLAWEKFKSNAQADEEIWTFMVTWNRGWIKQECRGYALLRGNDVAHHFMTGWANVETDCPLADFVS